MATGEKRRRSRAAPETSRRAGALEIMTGALLRAVGSLTAETMVPGGARHPRRVKRKTLRVPAFYFPDGRERTVPTRDALVLGHGHPRLEMCFPLSGELLLAVDGALYRLAAPDLAVLAPQVPHFECCGSPRRGYELAWLILDEGLPTMHVTEYTPLGGYTVRSRSSIGSLGEICGRLAAISSRRQWTTEDIAELRLSLLALADRAARFLSSGAAATADDAPEAVRQAQDFIRANYLERLSVADVAEAACLSPNYLSVLFREATGRTVLEAIHELKLAEAKARLRDPALPVKRIAYELGFESSHYFSRFFRKMTGATPSEFRASEAT